jgi:hypothetical protein
MSDKAANENAKQKKASAGKRKSKLDTILAEAKAVCGEINTTGARQLRKRKDGDRPAPAVKKAKKPQAPKKKAAAAAVVAGETS